MRARPAARPKPRAQPARKPSRRAGTRAALAQRLLSWLQQQGLEPGDHVPERLATQAFHVSRTPVRAALALLAERGALERRDRRGFFVAPGLAAPAVAVADSAEAALEDAILRDRHSKRLEAEVTAAQLARRYRASRAAILRVLNRLQKDGIVERALGQRWVFLPALDSLRSQEDSHRFRLIVEPAAFLQPGFALDRRRARALGAELRALAGQEPNQFDAKRALEADIAFHEAIADACNNRFLTEAIRRQSRLRRLAAGGLQVPQARLIESCRQHLEILEAAEAGDLARAAHLMREHLAASLRARPGFVNRGAPPMLRPPLVSGR